MVACRENFCLVAFSPRCLGMPPYIQGYSTTQALCQMLGFFKNLTVLQPIPEKVKHKISLLRLSPQLADLPESQLPGPRPSEVKQENLKI